MFHLAVAAFVLSAAAVAAAPAEDHWSADPSAEFLRAAAMVEAGDHARALPILRALSISDPGNADVHNLIGFSNRKTGDPVAADAAYQKALRLNPDHRGALEYQGELFLAQGDIASAQANLARLDAACPSSCEERDRLAAAIAGVKTAND